MGFAKRRDLIGGSIPTRDTIIPKGPEVLTERHKLQVSEHFVYFDTLAFLYKICRISGLSSTNYLHRQPLYLSKIFFET